jgi:hypothetical protein
MRMHTFHFAVIWTLFFLHSLLRERDTLALVAEGDS